jgi:hypothetical protein
MQGKGFKTNGPLFFVMCRNAGDNNRERYVATFKSEIKASKGGIVDWNKVELMANTLCNDDNTKKIKIEIFES